MRSPKRLRSGNNSRDDGNRSDGISLPKWATLQNYRYEPGGDFPAGPYNRMVGRLHLEGRLEHMGTDRLDPRLCLPGGLPLHVPDQRRLDALASRFVGSGWPRHYIDEARQIEIARLYSAGGQPVHHFDKPELYYRPAIVYPENAQPRYLDHEARLDAASARLYPAGAPSIHSANAARLDNAPATLRSADGYFTDSIDEGRLVKASARLLSDGQPNSIDKTGDRNAPAGIIFMCNKTTKKDCFQHKLFGLPMMHRQLVERIAPGTKLFLFEFDTRELHGIFEADSNGGMNLDSKAFGGSFPAQVHFRICKECKPLAEVDFKRAIQDNYYKQNKFNLELTSRQVVDLVRIFCPGEILEAREELNSMPLPVKTNALGMRECSTVDPSGNQQEIPNNLLFKEDQAYIHPVTAVAREFQPLFMDRQGLRPEAPTDDLRVGLRGLQSRPIERSLPLYLQPMEDTATFHSSLLRPEAFLGPSARGLMDNETLYMGLRRRFWPPLLENPRLAPASIGSERDLQASLGESKRVRDPHLVEQCRSIHSSLGESKRVRDPHLVEQCRSIHSSEVRLHTPVNTSEEKWQEDQININEKLIAVGSQKNLQPSLGESPREMHAVLVEHSRNMYPFGTSLHAQVNALEETLLEPQANTHGNGRDYLANQRIENNHYAMAANTDKFQDSLHQSDVSSSDLQSRATGSRGHRSGNSDVERADFHSIASLQDSIYPSYVASAGLQSFNISLKDLGFNQLDVERRHFYRQDSLQRSQHPSDELSYGLQSRSTVVQGPRLNDADVEMGRLHFQDTLPDSVYPHGVPSSGLQSGNAGVESQMNSDVNVDRGNLHSQATAMVDSSVIEQSRFWPERYYSSPMQSYANELEAARQQRSEYLERVYHMYEQELAEENNNEQGKELHGPHNPGHPGVENMKDVQGTTLGNQPAFYGHSDKQGDTSHMHTSKRVVEDHIMDTSNPYGRKRQYSYNESLEERAVDKRIPVDGVATTAGLTGNILSLGDNRDEPYLRPQSFDPPNLSDSRVLESSFHFSVNQEPDLISTNPIHISVLPAKRN